MASALPKVVFVLGAPGVGKGTQCAMLSKKYNCLHLSAGELLREERRKAGSPYAEQIEKHMRDGTIVPVEITVRLLDNAMNNSHGAAPFVLIDGFPRNKDNLDGWQRLMTEKADVASVLFFECEVATCIKRCLGRSEGRIDDNEETLRKRIRTFETETSYVVSHYEGVGIVARIDGSKPAESVFNDVEAALRKSNVITAA